MRHQNLIGNLDRRENQGSGKDKSDEISTFMVNVWAQSSKVCHNIY